MSDLLTSNYLFASVIIEELLRLQVVHFCLSPGSRSTPLVMALAESVRKLNISYTVHVDERSAAFFALGVSKAKGAPAVLVCTSGTAVANYLPAVVEASMSEIPLIVLSADRPVSLYGSGANQTIPQEGIFGEFVRASSTLTLPISEGEWRSALSRIDHTVEESVFPKPGPVHLNVCFEKPLVQRGGELPSCLHSWKEGSAPYIQTLRTHSSSTFPLSIREALQGAIRGVIVAGRMPFAWKNSVFELGRTLGMPILAEIDSELHFSSVKEKSLVFPHAPLFTKDIPQELAPDLLFHIGEVPLSEAFLSLLDTDVRCIQCVPTTARRDPTSRVRERVLWPPEIPLAIEVPALQKESVLAAAFSKASAALVEGWKENHSSFGEPSVVNHLLTSLQPGEAVYLGNSLPAREASACAPILPYDIPVGSNRGASGIDGIVASAAGFSQGLQKPVLLINGDISTLHDIGSLSLLTISSVQVCLVLLNNNGGRIFHTLPGVSDLSYFEEFFITPQSTTFEHAARQFKLEYHVVNSYNELSASLQAWRSSYRSLVIECSCDPSESFTEWRTLHDKGKAALLSACR